MKFGLSSPNNSSGSYALRSKLRIAASDCAAGKRGDKGQRGAGGKSSAEGGAPQTAAAVCGGFPDGKPFAAELITSVKP